MRHERIGQVSGAVLAGAIQIGAMGGMATSAQAATGFIIMGDSGTGKVEQYRVANAMVQTCQDKRCDFVLGLGDNIYEYGPNSAVDAQFDAKFEKPFADLAIPFFMVQGNHDNSLLIPGDGGFNQKGFHEVEYTQHSSKWRMPARYYSFEAQNDSALFIAFDSNPPNAYFPPLFNPYWWPNGTYVKAEKAWLDQTVAGSDSVWKFAFAHHPYMSNGHHMKDPLLQGHRPYNDLVKSSLCGKIDFILSGHEHALEVLAAQDDECGQTVQLVSGAAAKNSGARGQNKYVADWDSFEKKWGYMHGYIDGNTFTLTSYVVDENGGITQAFVKTFSK